MKFKYIYATLFGILCWLVNNSNSSGAGSTNFNCSNCHSGSSTTTTIDSLVLREVNTNEKAIRYSPNTNYIITLYGQNSSLTRFGFQATNNGKGSFSSPSGDCKVSGNIWEHQQRIIGTGSKFQVSARWTAPSAGNGLTTFNAYLNAVNNDNNTTGDKPSPLFSFAIDELTAGDSAKVKIEIIAGVNEPKGERPLKFQAIPTNGGTAPEYQWMVNSTKIGGRTTEDIYTAYTLNSKDTVYCYMYSNKPGALPIPAISEKIIIKQTGGSAQIVKENSKKIGLYVEQGKIRVSYDNYFRSQLNIYNLSGQKLLTQFIDNQSEIDTKSLAKGVYLAQMTINGQTWSQKIVLE